MAKPKRIKEAQAAYGAAAVDLKEPIILERDGQPMAVILSFEDYQRLRELEKGGPAQAGWRERFEQLLTQVHSHTAQYSSEEIEAEITAAFQEVREIRYGHRRPD